MSERWSPGGPVKGGIATPHPKLTEDPMTDDRMGSSAVCSCWDNQGHRRHLEPDWVGRVRRAPPRRVSLFAVLRGCTGVGHRDCRSRCDKPMPAASATPRTDQPAAEAKGSREG